MTIIKKRPGGLGSAAASKKSKVDAPAVDATTPATDATETNDTMTFQLDDESMDEVTEIKTMFEAALAKIEENEEDGVPLLQGVIHECDRLVRTRYATDEAEAKPETEVAPLTPDFHLTYGSALFRLSLVVLEQEESQEDSEEAAESTSSKNKSTKETAVDFMDAAIDRFEIGLDNEFKDEDLEVKWKLNEALGRVYVQKAAQLLKAGDVDSADTNISKAQTYLTTSLSLLSKSPSKSTYLEESVSVAGLFTAHAELRTDKKGHEKWIGVALEILKDVLKQDTSFGPALEALGAAYLSSANAYMDMLENGEDDVERVVISECIDDALKYLQQAQDLQKDAKEPNCGLLCLIGEALVNKGNMLDEKDEEGEADVYYQQAVDCFKKVDAVNPQELPEQFGSFLKEWEADLAQNTRERIFGTPWYDDNPSAFDPHIRLGKPKSNICKTNNAPFQQEYQGTTPDANTNDSNVLFREGISPKGYATYAPRLIVVDLKGSLGSLKKSNPHYEDDDETSHAWGGKVDKFKQEPYKKNEFLQHLDAEEDAMQVDNETTNNKNSIPQPPRSFAKELDSSVSVWSDFNSLFYHPRSIVELSAYQYDDSKAPFALFTQGRDVWRNDPDLRDDLLEHRLRYFLEECDSPQGIQVFADAHNGFGGFSAEMVEAVREEVGKLPIVVFGIVEEAGRGDDNLSIAREASTAMTLSSMASSASVYIPLYAPSLASTESSAWRNHLNSNLKSRYHWTAYLSSIIETATLPSRHTNSPHSLSSILHPISTNAPLASLAASVPFPASSTQEAVNALSKEYQKVDWMLDLTLRTPWDEMESNGGQFTVLRGYNPAGAPVGALEEALAKFAGSSPAPRECNLTFTSPTGHPITPTTPALYLSNYTTNIPVLTRLRCTSRLSGHLQESAKDVERVLGNLRVLEMIDGGTAGGMGRDDCKQVVEELHGWASKFEEI
ncbi:mtDNA inheritance, partitioning of the mitochondrial organelle [Chytridiales sp. JEL 0842]|nr:mtDNA inheritance, partitioning of the mitochondrial organelle [Chytridiales sp. JEL 0842]